MWAEWGGGIKRSTPSSLLSRTSVSRRRVSLCPSRGMRVFPRRFLLLLPILLLLLLLLLFRSFCLWLLQRCGSRTPCSFRRSCVALVFEFLPPQHLFTCYNSVSPQPNVERAPMCLRSPRSNWRSSHRTVTYGTVFSTSLWYLFLVQVKPQ